MAGLFRHPNIVEATDAGMFDGKPYLVSEFLCGTDLQDLIDKNGPLPIQQAADMIVQAAKGLDQIHQKGVVHRDIKPSNLFLTDDGVVKILDLGLARSAVQTVDPKQTMTGQIVGSPGFMSPEQYRGEAVDSRTDIYSLGCTLVYLLTGKPRMENRTKLPPKLNAIIAQMTAGMPEQRFQSASELLEALNTLAPTHNIEAIIRRHAVSILIGVAALLIVGFVMIRGGEPGVGSDVELNSKTQSDEERRAEYLNSPGFKEIADFYKAEDERHKQERAEYEKEIRSRENKKKSTDGTESPDEALGAPAAPSPPPVPY